MAEIGADEWVVVVEDRFPSELVAAAAASQASLAPKLAELRAVALAYPGGPGPAAGDRWIADRPR